ncbi:MAG TPA: hypothetical protein VM598_02280, partial [Bdellovibrionota bacterium]|nr:hypothetical protein [Bdellovibrionota bacterium]
MRTAALLLILWTSQAALADPVTLLLAPREGHRARALHAPPAIPAELLEGLPERVFSATESDA